MNTRTTPSWTERQALSYVALHGPVTAFQVGVAMWSDQVMFGHRPGALARPAGAVLHRLRARGLVDRERGKWTVRWFPAKVAT